MTSTAPSIALVGVTGFGGSAILDEFLRRGIPVTAITRRPLQFGDGVTAVIANVYDTPSLVSALRGIDVVVSAFNPGWADADLHDRYLEGSRSIHRAAVDAGVERLVVLGGSASLSDGAGGRRIDHLDLPEPYDGGVRAAMEYFDELRESRDIDWTYVSPAPEWGPVGPTERRGVYRRGADEAVVGSDGRATISSADLALAIVDEVVRPSIRRGRFTVGW